MAASVLVVKQITRLGVDAALAAANADGNWFVNDGRCFVLIGNGGVPELTITFETPGAVDGLAITDRAVAIAGGDAEMIGPFPRTIYNDEDAQVNITYSAVGDLTIAAFRL